MHYAHTSGSVAQSEFFGDIRQHYHANLGHTLAEKPITSLISFGGRLFRGWLFTGKAQENGNGQTLIDDRNR
jgi:hypothetical protein